MKINENQRKSMKIYENQGKSGHPEPFRGHFMLILGSIWAHPGLNLASSWDQNRPIQANFSLVLGHFLVILGSAACPIGLNSFRAPTGRGILRAVIVYIATWRSSLDRSQVQIPRIVIQYFLCVSGGLGQQAYRITCHETFLIRSDLDQTLHAGIYRINIEFAVPGRRKLSMLMSFWMLFRFFRKS